MKIDLELIIQEESGIQICGEATNNWGAPKNCRSLSLAVLLSYPLFEEAGQVY
jgi:hypothetical protein